MFFFSPVNRSYVDFIIGPTTRTQEGESESVSG